MELYDDPNRLKGEAQDMRFKSFDGIEIRPSIVEGSNFETRVGSFMPNRFAPAMFQQSSLAKGVNNNFVNTPMINDYFAMPMGTIVSATHFSPSTRQSSISSMITGGAGTPYAQFGINSSGEIIIHIDRNGDAIVKRADMEWFNYPKEMLGLFDIAYGDATTLSAAVQDPYSAYDVDAETIAINYGDGLHLVDGGQPIIVSPSTGAVVTDIPGVNYRVRGNVIGVNTYSAAADTTPTMATGGVQPIPYGVVIKDVPIDIEGRYLNYSQQLMKGSGGILMKGRIRIPFVYNHRGGYELNMGPASGATNQTGASVFALPLSLANTGATIDTLFDVTPGGPNSTGYMAIRGKHSFLLLDSVAVDLSYGTTSIPPGAYLEPNRDGKFIMSQASSPTGTGQRMARLEALDSRLPKNMNEIVETYPGSETTGTQTGGVDQYLFRFAKSVLAVSPAATQAAYNPNTIVGVVDAIQDGLFGYAHIYVDCFSSASFR